MLTEVEAVTARVVTVKVAPVAPAGTVTLAGTVATAVLLLERRTMAPPVRAGPLSVTLPVERDPPLTLLGFSASEGRGWWGWGRRWGAGLEGTGWGAGGKKRFYWGKGRRRRRKSVRAQSV